jgi:hypothetical protein
VMAIMAFCRIRNRRRQAIRSRRRNVAAAKEAFWK